MATNPTTIGFRQVSSNLEVPGAYMEFDSANANNSAQAANYTYLVMGQMLAAGVATPLVPIEITGGKAQADVLFGQGSMLSNMIAGAVAANSNVKLVALPTLDLVAGTAAAGSIAFTGTATNNGLITAYIGYSGLIVPAQIAVSAGETAVQIAAALASAINAVLDLPVTATVDATTTSQVDIKARHKGAEAGVIDIRLAYASSDVLPTGITATIVPMTGGAGNPSATPMIAAIGDTRYDIIALPWNDTATYQAWFAESARRWNALVEAEPCLVSSFHGTPGAANTLLAAMNSQWQDLYASFNALTPSFVECAVIGAVYCANLPNRPNAPQLGTLLPNIMAPAIGDRLTFQERQLLYTEGGACWKVQDGGAVILERAVTTYKTNAQGAADNSYHERAIMATLTFLRRSWTDFMATRYPNCTFADDGTPVIAGEVTSQLLAQGTLAWYQKMMELGLVQNFAAFQNALQSIRNAQNHSRNDQLLAPNIVGPLNIIAGQMAFVE